MSNLIGAAAASLLVPGQSPILAAPAPLPSSIAYRLRRCSAQFSPQAAFIVGNGSMLRILLADQNRIAIGFSTDDTQAYLTNGDDSNNNPIIALTNNSGVILVDIDTYGAHVQYQWFAKCAVGKNVYAITLVMYPGS